MNISREEYRAMREIILMLVFTRQEVMKRNPEIWEAFSPLGEDLNNAVRAIAQIEDREKKTFTG